MQNSATLSPEQERVLDLYRAGKNVFITGQGGTGKSFVLREITKDAAARNKTYQVCALSGRAAVLLNCKARTIHSWSGIRLARGKNEDIVNRALKKRGATKTWRQVDVLIVDEVSMMSLKIFEILNDIAKIARKNYHEPFGGLQVIFIGDFFQLPPVGDAEDPDSSKYCFDGPLWNEVFPPQNHVILTHIFRQKDDERFKKILAQVREGRISRSSNDVLCGLVGRTPDPALAITPTRLFPLRASADNLNARMFSQIDAPVYTYEAAIYTKNTTYLDDGTSIPIDILRECEKLSAEQRQYEINTMIENSPCSSTLLLKEGAVVMLCYNIDVEMGLCNGSQGVVVGFTSPSTAPAPTTNQNVAVVKMDENAASSASPLPPSNLPGGKFPLVKFTNGITMVIPMKDYQSTNYPTISFSQIPLKLAWGLTIHSSQGATLDLAEIDIGSGIFEVGQTYVALSRVRSLEGLYLIGYDPTKIKISKKVMDFYNALALVRGSLTL